jgi:hypothetical protein
MVAASSSKSAAAAHKVAVSAPASVPALALKAELTVELGRFGGAAIRLLVAARGSSGGGGGGSMVSGPQCIPIHSAEAARVCHTTRVVIVFR